MTDRLARVVHRLRASDRLEADPGPVCAARDYVEETLLVDDGSAVERSAPMLVGALLTLLRHVRHDPSLSTLRNGSREPGRAGARAWRVVTCDGPEHPPGEYATELEAVVAALEAVQ